MADIKRDNLLIIGDFNLRSIDWLDETCNNNETHIANKFLKAYAEAGLHQHQKEMTRFRKGETPSLFDLVLTNKEAMIDNISTEAGLGKSDHMTLEITLNLSSPKKTLPPRPCFSRTNEETLKKYLKEIS